MNVFQFFTPKAETFYLNANSTIRQTLEKFDYHKFSVVPLIDDNGMYVTSLSEGDILRFIKNNARFDMSLAENVRIMDIEHYRPYQACKSDVPMARIYQLALEQNFVPIVDDRGVYIGIIKRKTLLHRLYDKVQNKQELME